MRIEITEKDVQYFLNNGIENPIEHLKDLINFEDYVGTNYPDVNNEAWADVITYKQVCKSESKGE